MQTQTEQQDRSECRRLNAALAREAAVIADAEGIDLHAARQKALEQMRERMEAEAEREAHARRTRNLWNDVPLPDLPLAEIGQGDQRKTITANTRFMPSGGNIVGIVLCAAAILSMAGLLYLVLKQIGGAW